MLFHYSYSTMMIYYINEKFIKKKMISWKSSDLNSNLNN